MTQVQNDLLTIKAYGRAAEHKLKGLLSLTRSEVQRLPHKQVTRVNQICADLVSGYDDSILNPLEGAGYVPVGLRAEVCE